MPRLLSIFLLLDPLRTHKVYSFYGGGQHG